MSRKLAEKWVIKGDLVAQTAVSVGGMGASGPVDLALAQDGRGRPFIPGTSLTGPLRRWVELNDDKSTAEAVFGFEADRSESGHASWLTVSDAFIGDSVVPVVRPGIQIDRDTGATRTGFFYQREVWPRGTTIPFEMELDVPIEAVKSSGATDATVSPAEFPKAILGLVAALAGPGLRFGGGKTRGGGRLKLENAQVHKYDFTPRSGAVPGLFAWLRRDGSAATVPVAAGPTNDKSLLAFDIHWRPTGAVMAKAAAAADNVLMARTEPIGGGQEAFVLPGSGLKGILRQRSALILRTALGVPPDVDPNSANPDGDLPLLLDLYGSTAVAGRVLVEDCFEALPDAQPGQLPESLARTTLNHHVAIDRFTGGASDKALFSTRPPKSSTKWGPVRLELSTARKKFAVDEAGANLHTLSVDDRDAELALFMLTLRDLVQGWIPLGFATRRGMGTIEVKSIDVASRGSLPHGFDVLKWCKRNEPLPGNLSTAWIKLVSAKGKLTIPTSALERGNR